MGIKGEIAKNRIISTAKQLFTAKGYSAVTMQDVCRGTELSRGGLYRHFSSTEEIFCAIIVQEQNKAYSDLEKAKEAKVAIPVMLTVFLKARLNNLLSSDIAFDNAVSEFAANSEAGKALLAQRAENSVEVLSKLIEDGCADGDFKCDDAKTVAKHILWTLEGMAKHNALIPITKEEIIKQSSIFSAMLGTENKIL